MPETDLNTWGYDRNASGEIQVGDISAKTIAEQFGTPVHVVSQSKLTASASNFQNIFKKAYADTKVFYAYKANSIPGILQIIHSQGLGAEVISGYELWLALKVGVPPGNVIFNGPLKTKDDLELAISKKIYSINIDSYDDLVRIEETAKALGQTANVGLRLSIQGGYQNFGIPPENEIFWEVVRKLSESPHLNYRGLMTHIGGRATDAAIYKLAITTMAKLAGTINDRFQMETFFLDIGGGFGVDTLKGYSLVENALYRKFNIPPRPPNRSKFTPIGQVAREIADNLNRACTENNIHPPTLVVEPGRIIVAQPQILLLTVAAVKDYIKQPVAMTDGGRFNITYPVDHEYHQIFLANREENGKRYPYFIGGRICTVGDFVNRNKALPRLRAGDLLAVMDSGAYFTQFSSNFSFPRPAIIMVDGTDCRIIRKRETYDHLVAMDTIEGS